MNLNQKIAELIDRGCSACPHVVVADKGVAARYKVAMGSLGLQTPGCIEWKGVEGQVHDLFLVHANRHFRTSAVTIDELLELTDPKKTKAPAVEVVKVEKPKKTPKKAAAKPKKTPKKAAAKPKKKPAKKK